MLAAGLPDSDRLRDELLVLLGGMAFYQLDRLNAPRSEQEFNERRKQGHLWITPATQELSRFVGPLLERHHELRLLLDDLQSDTFRAAHDDLAHQRDALLQAGFLTHTPWRRLQHVPRYLQAAVVRLEKVRGNPQRDQQHQATVSAFQQQWDSLTPEQQEAPDFVEFRWMLEELRVSLYAQELGTAGKISPTRLEKQWERALA